jgi:hypothetical protein
MNYEDDKTPTSPAPPSVPPEMPSGPPYPMEGEPPRIMPHPPQSEALETQFRQRATDDLYNVPPPRPDDTPVSLNRGRARERVRRRQEGRLPMVQPSGGLPRAARPAPQIKPAGAFEMPKIRLPFSPVWLGVVAGGMFVLAVVFALGQFAGEAPVAPPNGIWIGTEWTYAEFNADNIRALAEDLRAHEIGTVYAWVSWLQADKTWRGADNGSFDRVKTFVQGMKAVYPEMRLVGWLGIPVDAGEGYRLDDAEVQQLVADFSARVVNPEDFGFDGVFLNIEQIWDGDEAYLDTLRLVRQTLGADGFISTAIPPDWSPRGATIPVPPLIVPGTEWALEYKRSVALLVDELALMAYNSGLTSAADYQVWMAYQVQAYAEAVHSLDTGAGAGAHVMVGIPTYDAEPPGHDPLVENVASAVAGIRLGLQQAGEAAEVVQGAAIYAGWTTEEAEWQQFRTLWGDGQ